MEHQAHARESKVRAREPLKEPCPTTFLGEQHHEGTMMDDKIARLRTHQKNIDRYQDLLKTTLTQTEVQYLEKRLSEERLAMATLGLMSPNDLSKGHDLPGAPMKTLPAPVVQCNVPQPLTPGQVESPA